MDYDQLESVINPGVTRRHQCPQCKKVVDGVMRVILVSPCCFRPLDFNTTVFVSESDPDRLPDFSWLDEMLVLIEASGARVTFDSERDITKPCWCCGRADVPRELVQIGHYLNPHHDPLVRPVCAGCSAQMMASNEVEKSATTVA